MLCVAAAPVCSSEFEGLLPRPLKADYVTANDTRTMFAAPFWPRCDRPRVFGVGTQLNVPATLKVKVLRLNANKLLCVM